MTASYTVMDYIGLALATGLGSMVFILLASICLIRKLGARFKNPRLLFSLVSIPILACILLCSWLIPVFNQLGDLLIPSEYVVRTTAGKIDTVTPGDLKIWHFRNGTLRVGEEIVVDSSSYYVISEGVLTEGLYIELQYAQCESNVILSWKEVTPEIAEQIRAESLLTETEKPVEALEPEVSHGSECIGTWLWRIGLFGFIAIVVLTTIFRQKIAKKLLKQDALVRGEIKPNRSALLLQLLPSACFCLIILGMVIGGAQHHAALVILVIGVGGMAAFMGADATTGLKLNGNTFIIRRLGKEKIYRLDDVRAVFWRRGRGLIGWTMVLVLDDGKSYWFHMDSFSGVEFVYKYMSQYLEDAQQ